MHVSRATAKLNGHTFSYHQMVGEEKNSCDFQLVILSIFINTKTSDALRPAFFPAATVKPIKEKLNSFVCFVLQILIKTFHLLLKNIIFLKNVTEVCLVICLDIRAENRLEVHEEIYSEIY